MFVCFIEELWLTALLLTQAVGQEIGQHFILEVLKWEEWLNEFYLFTMWVCGLTWLSTINHFSMSQILACIIGCQMYDATHYLHYKI